MGTHPNPGMLSRSAHGGLSRPTARRNALRKSLPRQPAEITDEQIARRAYEIYQARADGEGDALGDWLTAVRELRQRVDAPSETPSRGDRNVYP